MKVIKAYGSPFAILAILIVFIYGCEFWYNTFPPDPPGTLLTSDSCVRNLSPNTDSLETVVTAGTDFTLTMMRTVAAGQTDTDNLIFSPYSVSTALAMVYAGAGSGSSTETEFREVFGFPEQAACHEGYNALDLAVEEAAESGDFTLTTVNSVWGQEDVPFETAYLDILAENYGAGVNLVDFMESAEYYRKEINAWIGKVTAWRITDPLPEGSLTADTRLVISNAVYFKADWETRFEKADTADGDFTLLDGSTIQTPLMYQEGSFPYAASVDGAWQAVELPYAGGSIAVLFILPEDGSFDSFIDALNAETLLAITDSLTETSVNVTLPSFSFEWGGSISDYLKEMGMTTPFLPGEADFSGIDGGRDLFLSDVIHKGFVAVDEEGTEAAAVTIALILATSIMPAETSITLTRPFLFFIRELETCAVLFTGIVRKP
jgi:serpin B